MKIKVKLATKEHLSSKPPDSEDLYLTGVELAHMSNVGARNPRDPMVAGAEAAVDVCGRACADVAVALPAVAHARRAVYALCVQRFA